MDKCPKCGAGPFFVGRDEWPCGTCREGDTVVQGDLCRAYVAEAEVERLIVDIANAHSFIFNITEPRTEEDMLPTLDEQIELLRLRHKVEVERLRDGCHPECPECGLKPNNEEGKAILHCDECYSELKIVAKELQAELARFRRDYRAFEELSPPDVSRSEFVRWCFEAWEEKCEREQREAAEEARRKA